MAKKRRNTKRSTRKPMFAPGVTNNSGTSGILVRRAPKFPPQMTYGPPVTRTIRVTGGISAGGALVFASTPFFVSDAKEYLGAETTVTARFQGLNVIGARVWLFATSVGIPQLIVSINSLSSSASSGSNTSFLLSDVGSISEPASVAWQWPVGVQGINITPPSSRDLFQVTNNSASNCQYLIDFCATWTP